LAPILEARLGIGLLSDSWETSPGSSVLAAPGCADRPVSPKLSAQIGNSIGYEDLIDDRNLYRNWAVAHPVMGRIIAGVMVDSYMLARDLGSDG